MSDFISCLSAEMQKGDDSCHHSSIFHSTHRKLIDSVISVDTLRSTGATGKGFHTPPLHSSILGTHTDRSL